MTGTTQSGLWALPRPTWQGVGFLPRLTLNSTDLLLWGGWGS